MKKTITTIIITAIIISTLPSFQCGKEVLAPNPNYISCTEKRTEYKSITDKEGVIIQSRFGRYAIKIIDGNPAQELIAIPCELNTMNVVGATVLISGNLKIFNTKNFLPSDFDKSKCYFLEITKIISKI